MATFDKSETGGVQSDNNVNKKMKDLLNKAMASADANGEDVKENPHDNPPSGKTTSEGLFGGNLMQFTKMLEYVLEHMSEETEDDILDSPVDDIPSPAVDDDDILNELDKLFTPILITQNYEKEIQDKKNESMSEAGILTEQNVITFDDQSRMSQLISTCALLLARKKNTEKWQMFNKAAAIKKQAKIDIQKEEYTDAKALAQKYLVKVSTTNNSSVARNAATELLPQTQH